METKMIRAAIAAICVAAAFADDVIVSGETAFSVSPGWEDAEIAARENIEWSISYAYHLTDSGKDLPRVLLVGDSICNFYKDNVISYLDGRMNVTYWVSSFCATSPLHELAFKTHLAQSRYDVVHFNNGLHSLDADVTGWTNGIVGAWASIRARQPQAALVWCTTTPTTNAAKTACVEKLNAAALAAAGNSPGVGPMRVDDLFSLMDPLSRSSYWVDEVHPSTAGRAIEAERVAASVYHAYCFPPIAGELTYIYQPFATSAETVMFRGTRLKDITNFTCVIWGASTSIRGGRGFCTYRDDTTADVQFRSFDDGTMWCVKVRFRQDGDNIFGKAVYAKYAKNCSSIDFDFDSGGNSMPIAPSRTGSGYGACEITARCESKDKDLVIQMR